MNSKVFAWAVGGLVLTLAGRAAASDDELLLASAAPLLGARLTPRVIEGVSKNLERRVAALALPASAAPMSDLDRALANLRAPARDDETLAPRSAVDAETLGIGKLPEVKHYRVRYHAPIYSTPEDTILSREPARLTLASMVAVDRVMGGAVPKVSTCYEQILARRLNIEGTVVIGATYDADGRLKDAHVIESSVLEHDFERCIIEAMGAVRGRDIPSGVEVVQPWTFVRKR